MKLNIKEDIKNLFVNELVLPITDGAMELFYTQWKGFFVDLHGYREGLRENNWIVQVVPFLKNYPKTAAACQLFLRFLMLAYAISVVGLVYYVIPAAILGSGPYGLAILGGVGVAVALWVGFRFSYAILAQKKAFNKSLDDIHLSIDVVDKVESEIVNMKNDVDAHERKINAKAVEKFHYSQLIKEFVKKSSNAEQTNGVNEIYRNSTESLTKDYERLRKDELELVNSQEIKIAELAEKRTDYALLKDNLSKKLTAFEIKTGIDLMKPKVYGKSFKEILQTGIYRLLNWVGLYEKAKEQQANAAGNVEQRNIVSMFSELPLLLLNDLEKDIKTKTDSFVNKALQEVIKKRTELQNSQNDDDKDNKYRGYVFQEKLSNVRDVLVKEFGGEVKANIAKKLNEHIKKMNVIDVSTGERTYKLREMVQTHIAKDAIKIQKMFRGRRIRQKFKLSIAALKKPKKPEPTKLKPKPKPPGRVVRVQGE